MNKQNKEGGAAWREFLAVRFAWGKDPKNPYLKGTKHHVAWRTGYTSNESKWFGK